MSVNEKLQMLRSQMQLLGLSAVIIRTDDPHCSEYPANHYKMREYMSGFTGSAGMLVVSMKHAGLWTDSRYYLQGAMQLKDSEIELFRQGMPGVPSYIDYLTYTLTDGDVVGVDGFCLPYEEYESMQAEFGKYGIEIKLDIDILYDLYLNREPMPQDEIIEMDYSLGQLSRSEKVDLVRSELIKNNASHYIVSALDEVAWLMNMRGSDIEYNPVFYAYVLISPEDVTLYVDPHKITSVISKRLAEEGIKLSPYIHFPKNMQAITGGSVVYFDARKTNARTVLQLPSDVKPMAGVSIIESLKAVKTPREIELMEKAHLLDGVAMVNFLHWLEKAHNAGEHLTELSVSDKLLVFRKQQEGFVSESFATISGFGPNGAIVHYEATPETDAAISEGFLLLDSGAQFSFGTTDITRTIQFGSVAEQAKIDYTLVLKGHIALAMAKFPEGTRAAQIDVLARMAMWQQGINYGHGTGHGVGFYLNVHEGPQRIAPKDNGAELKVGMITTNEPGIYREGKWGVRIENVMVAQMAQQTEFGTFISQRPLTLCPIDVRPIVKEMLTAEEVIWLNNYHALVFETLKPLVSEEVGLWLKEATKAI